LFLSSPRLWPAYPFLLVVRRTAVEECGLLMDLVGLYGLYGYGSTVFLVNLFDLPPTLAEFLALPRRAFDSADEVFDAGWRVD
jgi:hypothetical protein